MNYQEYYLNKAIQKKILEFSRDREIAVQFHNGAYGKRPQSLESIREIDAFVKKGVTSFHSSEERWVNPMLLENADEETISKARKGWDLVIDIDSVDLEYSKIVARSVLDFFEELGINHASIKFSGNKGFHIGIPFEAFSEEILGIGETKDLFPAVARKIAAYIVYENNERICNRILEREGSKEKIAENNDMDVAKLTDEDGNFTFAKLVEIDTMLISSRHLFRMPYSINEKSGLVSIPILPERTMYFRREEARPEKVKTAINKGVDFLDYREEHGKYGNVLIVKAYEEDYEKEIFKDIPSPAEDKIVEITETVPMNRFPETIKYVLNNKFEDGRKRLLFLLLTFLTSVNWKLENIEEVVTEWAENQGLKKNYYTGQINWFKRQNRKIMPPNFSKDAYFRDAGIPEGILKKDIEFKNKKNKNLLNCIRQSASK